MFRPFSYLVKSKIQKRKKELRKLQSTKKRKNEKKKISQSGQVNLNSWLQIEFLGDTYILLCFWEHFINFINHISTDKLSTWRNFHIFDIRAFSQFSFYSLIFIFRGKFEVCQVLLVVKCFSVFWSILPSGFFAILRA